MCIRYGDSGRWVPFIVSTYAKQTLSSVRLHFSSRPSNDLSDHGHIFLCSRFGVFQDYYLKHPPYNKSSEAAINSIGTIALALQYILMAWVIDTYQKHPRWSRYMTFMGLFTCALSLLLAGFATSVSLSPSRCSGITSQPSIPPIDLGAHTHSRGHVRARSIVPLWPRSSLCEIS